MPRESVDFCVKSLFASEFKAESALGFSLTFAIFYINKLPCVLLMLMLNPLCFTLI